MATEMARRRREDSDWPTLMAGAAVALWGWRLELAGVALLALAHVRLAGLVGAVAATVLLVLLVLVVVVVPASRRWTLRVLLAARVRRRWRRAWMHCWLPPVRAGRVRSVPAGELVRVRASRGTSLDALAGRAEELAACLGLRELRVERDDGNAATGTVTLVRRDAFATLATTPWPHAVAQRLSLWAPVPFGVDELGKIVSVGLPERNVLLGGEPGAGKSAALSLLVATAALDPDCRLWLLDGKLVELSVWAPCAQRLAGPDVGEAIELLRELRQVMEQRYRELLAGGRRKVAPEDGLPLHLVACDELAFYLTCEDRKQRGTFAELLRDLVARGRAAGVIVCAATQKPASDVVPSALRDLFGFRLALRCNTPQASDTILGQGWATQGYSAATIAPGQRGVGLLLAEDGTPVRMRGYYLPDEEITAIAERASSLRADAWLREGDATEASA
jgi:hypothetical protein